MRARFRRFVIVTAVLATVGLVGFLWISSSFLLTPNRHELEPRHHAVLNQPAEYGLELETFRVKTTDGIGLAAMLVTRADHPGKAEKSRRMASLLGVPFSGPAPAPRGTVFLLHGRSGKKEDMLAVAERLVAADYRCLIYDARCHGESDGVNCTFGYAETGDFRTILDHTLSLLEARGEDPGQICALGISLGASVILQALPDETRIEAIVAVAPFATLPEVVNHSARRNIYQHIPLWLIAGTMRTGGLRAGFDPFQVSPLRGVELSNRSIFFVHGEQDAVIPVDHTRRLHAAAKGNKKLLLVADGNHTNVLAKGGDALYHEMIRFFLGAPRT